MGQSPMNLVDSLHFSKRSNGSRRSGRALVWVVAVLVVAGAALLFGAKSVFASKPKSVGTASTFPESVSFHDGRFYWLEKPKKGPVKLVRTGSSGIDTIHSAEAISGYGASGDWVVYAAKENGKYVVRAWGGPGRENQLASDEREVVTASIFGRDAYWLVKEGPQGDDASPLPAVGPKLQVMTAPASGGAAKLAAALLESDGALLGIQNGQLYLAGYRAGSGGSSAFYSIPTAGGPAKRIAGDGGRASALLAKDGSIYWTAPSRESSDVGNMWCIRRLNPGSKPEVYSDWLRARGEIFESDRGIAYVDGAVRPAVWVPRSADKFPSLIPLDSELIPIGVGSSDILSFSDTASRTNLPLTVVALP